jgi:hypothetical protein
MNESHRVRTQPKHVERAMGRVDHPRVRDPEASIQRHLVLLVDARRCWRKDFTDPIRSDVEVRLLRERWHAFPPPTGQIRHQHILPEVELRLGDDEPFRPSSHG